MSLLRSPYLDSVGPPQLHAERAAPVGKAKSWLSSLISTCTVVPTAASDLPACILLYAQCVLNNEAPIHVGALAIVKAQPNDSVLALSVPAWRSREICMTKFLMKLPAALLALLDCSALHRTPA